MKSTTQNGNGRPVVLVVDDDPNVQRLAHLQLAEGFDVVAAGDGRQCVELAVARRPDVILLDTTLPGVDGVNVLAQLNAHPLTEGIPVIFVSALATVEERISGLESGAVDYITEFEPRELRARIGAAARTHARAERLRAAQTADTLTGLPGRAAFESRLAEEIARSKRSSAALSIALIEVDRMEALNSALGRVAGDELLRSVGACMRQVLRTSDALFRYGGDEFAAILPDSNIGTAFLAAERLRGTLAVTMRGSVTPTLSIGIAEFSVGRSGEELIAKAEIALFRAKESGGDRSWRADDPRRHGLNPIALAEELTGREWDVLAHLARRRTEQEIARHLGISAGTVRSHKARIRRKLNVAPDVRLADFVNAHLRELIGRLGPLHEAAGR